MMESARPAEITRDHQKIGDGVNGTNATTVSSCRKMAHAYTVLPMREENLAIFINAELIHAVAMRSYS